MPLNVGEPLEIKRLVPRREGFSRISGISPSQSIPQENLFPLAPGNWIPRKDNFFDLGATGRVWKKIVVDTIEFDGGETMTAPGSTVTIAANNTTNETTYPVFVDGATGAQGLESDTGFTYNPSSGILTATAFSGTLSGTATLANAVTISANNTADETVYPTFVDGATGSQGLETDTGFTYNPNTGVLTATTFAGTVSVASVATTVTITDNESTSEENAIIFTAGGAKTGGNLGLESDGDLFYTPSLGKLQADILSTNEIRFKVVTIAGETPTTEYGAFRYVTSGAGAADSLGFSSGQTNATANRENAGSSFWTMLSESDGSSGSRLIFEPIVNYGSTDSTKNNAWIGYYKPLAGVVSYYFRAGGSSSYPAFSFSADPDTGIYRQASNIIGFAAGGAGIAGIYANGFYPIADDSYDLGTGSYRWDDIFATSGTVNTSDSRLKENIQPAKLGLDFINDLNPITYKWKKKKEDKIDATHHGIIAQEVIETLKDHGIDSLEDFGGIYHDGDDESYYGARYNEFIPILMKAVQELSAEVKELKEKVYA